MTDPPVRLPSRLVGPLACVLLTACPDNQPMATLPALTDPFGTGTTEAQGPVTAGETTTAPTTGSSPGPTSDPVTGSTAPSTDPGATDTTAPGTDGSTEATAADPPDTSDDTTAGETDATATATDAGSTGSSTGSTTGIPLNCGDGHEDADEECDDGNRSDTDYCTNKCTDAVCGDGHTQPGEMCDDAGDSQTCTKYCWFTTCGDGHVNQVTGEECDPGVPTADCDDDCSFTTCGDGHVNPYVEQCDDGNALDTDACLDTCEHATCNDGSVHAGVEACDDGNAVNDDGCDINCTPQTAFRYVFITGTATEAKSLGGLKGADMRCTTYANTRGLPGTYKAWLSDANASPSTRFVKYDVPYVRVDGKKVAENWADLTDGLLINPIDLQADGQPVVGGGSTACDSTKSVFVSTNQDGTAAASIDGFCSNWTKNVGDATFGYYPQKNDWWTEWCADSYGCESKALLYCFQQ